MNSQLRPTESPSWQPAPGPHRKPEAAEIDIWSLDLREPPVPIPRLRALLTPEEISRAQRFHFERHRRRFIVRRGAMRLLLGAYLGQSPESLRFTTGPNGKPDLASQPTEHRLVFNLSDTADFALLAVGEGEELGVDVESLERPRDAAKLVERYFSVAERHTFAHLPPELEVAGFFRGWTCKEAYLKAIGTGLQTPLRLSTVELDPRRGSRMIEIGDAPEEAAHWTLQELHPAPGYVGALAIRRHGNRVRTFAWSG